MKEIGVVIAIAIALIVVLAKPDENEDDKTSKYTTKYDNIDLDEILTSERLLNNYFKCLMDEGKCTPDGNDLKKNLPDAIENECSKCSEKQKEGTKRVIKFLVEKRKELWEQLLGKYDPKGEYKEKYEHFLKESDINTSK